MLSLLIAFSSFAYSYGFAYLYDEDYGFNQAGNIIKVSSEYVDSYYTHLKNKCADGFVEGVKIKREDNYDDKKCLNKNWVAKQDLYETHIDGSCTEGFVEGIKLKRRHDYDDKVCLNTSWVVKQTVYKTDADAQCADGFVEGVKMTFPRSYYKDKLCKRVKPLHK